VNIRQIAKLCGVSRTTVSLALRDDTSVAPATRARIRSLVEKLGYHPDPAIALQMTRIASRGRLARGTTIAMLSPWPERRAWENNWILEQFHDGIFEAASTLGYRVEEFWLRAPGMDDVRMNEILDHRGIRSAILLNHPESVGAVGGDWNRLVAVALGRTLVRPGLPAIDHDHFGGMALALDEIAKRGYGRIGLALFDDHHERARTQHQWEAAFALRGQSTSAAHRLPIFVGLREQAREFGGWFEQHRPDAVISNYAWARETLKASGAKVPRKTGFACLMWRHAGDGCAGVDMNCTAAGRLATELLHARLNANAHALALPCQTTLVAGAWRDGPSVQQVVSPPV
jgi:LacI family transcriptional regulator